MTINDFYQLFVGIFALLASVFILMSIILLVWSTLRIKMIFHRLAKTVRKAEETAADLHEFVDRNIDYIEMQKIKFESFNWLKSLISIIFKKRGEKYAKND